MLGKYEKFLFSVIKSLYFCQSGKVWMYSKNTAVYSSMIVVNILHSMHVWFWVNFVHYVFRNCIVVICFMPSPQGGTELKFECCVIEKSHLNAQRIGSTQYEKTKQPFKLCMFSFMKYLTSSLSLLWGPTLSAGFVCAPALGITVVFIACFSFWCY